MVTLDYIGVDIVVYKVSDSQCLKLAFILDRSNFNSFQIKFRFLILKFLTYCRNYFKLCRTVILCQWAPQKVIFCSRSWVLWIFRAITSYNKLIQMKIKLNLQFFWCMPKTDTDFWSYEFYSWTRFFGTISRNFT